MSMNLKIGIFIFLILCLATAVAAQSATHKAKPVINVDYSRDDISEGVEVTGTSLTGPDSKSYPVERIDDTSSKEVFRYRPTQDLPDGSYTFTVSAKSLGAGSKANSQTISFAVDTRMQFTILEPNRFGWSNQSVYNFKFSTGRELSSCRVARTEEAVKRDDISQPMGRDSSQKVFNYSEFNRIIPARGMAWVRCIDSEGNTFITNFSIEVRTSAPAISSLQATDNTVDSTLVTAETTHEAVCRYAINPAPALPPLWESMKPFESENELLQKDHVKTHKSFVQGQGIVLNIANNLSVKCRNLAGTFSDIKTTTFSIDTNAAESVKVTPASGSVVSRKFTLKAFTNGPAHCKYGVGSDAKDMADEDNDYTHKAEVEFSGEGTHKISLTCKFIVNDRDKTAELTYIVDSSAPSTPSVKVTGLAARNPDTIARNDRISGEWQSTDTQSGIRHYLASVYDISGQLVFGPEQTSEASGTFNVGLENQESYYLNVTAVNNAGLESPGRSQPVTVDISQISAECQNGVKNGLESGVDCGGPCQTCGTGLACTKNSDCTSGKCTGSVCQAQAQTTCSDFIKNQDETGVDCGGVCAKTEGKLCASGEGCTLDEDCKSSLFCLSNSCVSFSKSGGIDFGEDTGEFTEKPGETSTPPAEKQIISDESAQTTTREKGSPIFIMLVFFFLVIALIGGGTFAYYKIMRKRTRLKQEPKISDILPKEEKTEPKSFVQKRKTASQKKAEKLETKKSREKVFEQFEK